MSNLHLQGRTMDLGPMNHGNKKLLQGSFHQGKIMIFLRLLKRLDKHKTCAWDEVHTTQKEDRSFGLITLEIPALVRPLKSSNVELG